MATQKPLIISTVSKLVGQLPSTDFLLIGSTIQSNSGTISILPAADSTTAVQIQDASNAVVAAFDTSNARMNVGDGTAPTAMLRVVAGTTSASTAPVKLTAGTNNTAAENGTIEFSGTKWYMTKGGTRYEIALASAGGMTGFTNGASSYNTAVGVTSGTSITTGKYNSLCGYEAGKLLTGGDSNTIMGYQAGKALTTGSKHILIGMQSGAAVVDKNGWTAVGYRTLYSATAPTTYPIAIGWEAAQDATNCGIAIGREAGKATTDGTNINIGWRNMWAGAGSGGYCTLLGTEVFPYGTGQRNVMLGLYCGRGLGGGEYNVLLGGNAMQAGSGYSSSRNVVIGNAWNGLTSTSNDNVICGFATAATATSMTGNVCIGQFSAYQGHASTYNVFLGQGSGQQRTGANNVMIGEYAGFGAGNGAGNVGIQQNALYSLTTGTGNVAVGYQAGKAITTGAYNTLIGYNAAQFGAALTNSIVISVNDVTTSKGDNNSNLGSTTCTNSWLRGTNMHIGSEGAAADVTIKFECSDQATRPGIRWATASAALQTSKGGGNWYNIWGSGTAPPAHATTHKNGGGDEVATATSTASAIPKADSGGALDIEWMPKDARIATTISGGYYDWTTENTSGCLPNFNVDFPGATMYLFMCPKAGKIRDLRVSCVTGVAAGETVTFTVYGTTAGSGPSCTITDAGNTASDTSTETTVIAGERLAILWTGSATGAVLGPTASFDYIV